MTTLLQSFLLVFASEMGDKTQLLALVLAARYRAPWTIMAGILVATILNHGLASVAGGMLSAYFTAETLKWVLAITFFIFAGWILIPDKSDDLEHEDKYGPFLTTVVVFFLAEMGDKTQLATLALGAKFTNALLVTVGTTLGMLAADGLVVFFGDRLTKKIPMKWIRIFAAVLFALFGLGILLR